MGVVRSPCVNGMPSHGTFVLGLMQANTSLCKLRCRLMRGKQGDPFHMAHRVLKHGSRAFAPGQV